jgi:hypothetical protein
MRRLISIPWTSDFPALAEATPPTARPHATLRWVSTGWGFSLASHPSRARSHCTPEGLKQAI